MGAQSVCTLHWFCISRACAQRGQNSRRHFSLVLPARVLTLKETPKHTNASGARLCVYWWKKIRSQGGLRTFSVEASGMPTCQAGTPTPHYSQWGHSTFVKFCLVQNFSKLLLPLLKSDTADFTCLAAVRGLHSRAGRLFTHRPRRGDSSP